MNTATPHHVHEGRNLKRIREILQVKQQTLAQALGEDWNQKKISQLEDKESIDPALLAEVAKALNVPMDAIKNFDEQAAVFNIQNNYDGSNASASHIFSNNSNCTFNPIEKWLETLEENKKLYAALLKEKDEKIALLERLLEKK